MYLGGLDTLGAFLGLEEGFRRGREPHAQATGLGCHIAIRRPGGSGDRRVSQGKAGRLFCWESSGISWSPEPPRSATLGPWQWVG